MKAIGLLLLTVAAGAAAEPLTVRDRFSVSAGQFRQHMDLSGQVSAEGELDGEFNRFADDFDLGRRRTIDLFELSWSPAERHELSFAFYRDTLDRRATLSESFDFEDQTFPVDAHVRASLRFSSLTVDYTYWAWDHERSAVGFVVGVDRLHASLQLDGQAASDDNAVELHAAEQRTLYAPLVGVAGRWLVGDHVRAFGGLRAMQLRINGTDGRALSGRIGVEYFPWDRFGVALQYVDTRIRAARGGDIFDGKLDFGLSGPQLVLRYRY